MMPDSIKIVVLDRRLPVKKAFFALVQNGQYVCDLEGAILAINNNMCKHMYIQHHCWSMCIYYIKSRD